MNCRVLVVVVLVALVPVGTCGGAELAAVQGDGCVGCVTTCCADFI